jgi:hypothetical protein
MHPSLAVAVAANEDAAVRTTCSNETNINSGAIWLDPFLCVVESRAKKRK